jgi:iron complex transport system ATP-binding protein
MIPAVALRNVTASYDRNPAIQNISCSIDAGESVALIGPNGSGKSTLLSVLTGTVRADLGIVEIFGSPVQNLPTIELARQVAFVPQTEVPAFAFSVREVVMMGRLARSGTLFESDQDQSEVDSALAIADCLDFAERPVQELSGGERQRAFIARAIAQSCPIMLLDEPTSHLDVRHQLEVARLVRNLHSNSITVITALHDLNLVPEIADRVLLIRHGSLIADLPSREVLESTMLDEVFETTFRRLSSEGRVFLVPVNRG